MGDQSAIEWTEATWNPLAGCSRVSEGCRNCYAERQAIRIPRYQGTVVRSTSSGPRWTGNLMLRQEQLDQPLRWQRPRRIFVNSMSDLFHEKVPDEWIAAIFGVMWAAGHHTFQVLTKRPDRMLDFTRRLYREDDRASALMKAMLEYNIDRPAHPFGGWHHEALGNVWLGVSVEDQATADERIPILLQTPAAVRWISYEPALGPVDFAEVFSESAIALEPDGYGNTAILGGLNWIVIGGESGPGARPFDVAWARSTIDKCRIAGVKVFVKQLGARPYSMAGAYGDSFFGAKALMPAPGEEGRWYLRGEKRDRKGGDPAEWPSDLRVREYPR